MAKASRYPISAWANRHGVALLISGSIVFAWALWAPLLGRDMGSVDALGPDFLVLALAGGLMPSFTALLWHLGGGRVPPEARGNLTAASLLPLRMVAALLVVPVLAGVGIAVQVLAGLPYDLGQVSARLAVGIGWPLMAAVGEEFGWRGALLPLLRARLGALRAALLIGLVWGMWHLPSDWIGLKSQGRWFLPLFLVQGPILLTAHSVIMTWIWERTAGKTLSALLYHFGITASAILLGNQTRNLPGALNLAGAAIAASVVVLVAAAAGIGLSRAAARPSGA
jgi:membrane protease YdiL (CAAX protease family)